MEEQSNKKKYNFKKLFRKMYFRLYISLGVAISGSLVGFALTKLFTANFFSVPLFSLITFFVYAGYALLILWILIAFARKEVLYEERIQDMQEKENLILKAEGVLKENDWKKKYNKSSMVRESLLQLVDIMRDVLAFNGETNNKLDKIINNKSLDNNKKILEVQKILDYCFKTESSLKPSVKKCLDKICGIFRSDTALTTGGFPPYFKSTYYELIKGDILKRFEYSYPAQMHPNSDTIKISNPKATSYQCFRDRERKLVQNIPKELESAQKDKFYNPKWVELYPGQVINYKSMVCEPVFRGIVDGVKFRGVITVDTNSDDYFEENNEMDSFVSDLIHPFAILLALLYEICDQQSLLSHLISKIHT